MIDWDRTKVLRGEFHHIRSKLANYFFASKVTYRIWQIHPQNFLALGWSEPPQNWGTIYQKMRFFGKKMKKIKILLKYPIHFEESSNKLFWLWKGWNPPKSGEFAINGILFQKKYIFLASIFVVSFYEARRRYNIRCSKVTYRIWKIYPQIILALGRSEHPQNRGIIYHKMRFIGKKKWKKYIIS